MKALAAVLLVGQLGAASAKERPAKKAPEPTCKKIPGGKAVLKLNLKPDTEIADLIGWFSSVTCTPMLVSSSVSLAGKKVTITSPEPMTLAEVKRLFFAALESVGLTVEPNGKFLRIIEASRARSSVTPVETGRR